ncbi:MAG: oxygen-independent coproporphyrinogen III oxidase [Aureispira sp.]|nr:oxygen-independent coproporphyrinogen III oxidase [Aureispira sp.]
MDKQLIRKYNVPGPRYTSYPTVPFWATTPTQEEWSNLVKETFHATNTEEGISVYIHLPYCSSLCTYCGCNKRITVNHAVELPYIHSILKEWQLYLNLFEVAPRIREIHLGGGTPTFFSPENLKFLITELLRGCELCDDAQLGLEGHPKNTTAQHLEVLYELGFRRLSLGIQDFDEAVQKVINRVQPYEMVEMATETARALGYTSVNFDLIYGLPLQTIDTVRKTIELVNQLKPDRIAFYSYAHVPWQTPGQRSYSEKDLPNNEEKRALYELGKEMFEELGYVEIGMDHFAVPSDSLTIAFNNRSLHRNFMGYTPVHDHLMIGLGASSISDSWTGFAQNIKKVEDYQKAVDSGEFPFYRGHVLSEQDLVLRRHILEIMCHFETSWEEEEMQNEVIFEGLTKLTELIEDGLVEVSETKLRVTDKGKPFVRNICMCFDEYLFKKKSDTPIFSQTI